MGVGWNHPHPRGDEDVGKERDNLKVRWSLRFCEAKSQDKGKKVV